MEFNYECARVASISSSRHDAEWNQNSKSNKQNEINIEIAMCRRSTQAKHENISKSTVQCSMFVFRCPECPICFVRQNADIIYSFVCFYHIDNPIKITKTENGNLCSVVPWHFPERQNDTCSFLPLLLTGNDRYTVESGQLRLGICLRLFAYIQSGRSNFYGSQKWSLKSYYLAPSITHKSPWWMIYMMWHLRDKKKENVVLQTHAR